MTERFRCDFLLSTGVDCMLIIPHAHLPKEMIGSVAIRQSAEDWMEPELYRLKEAIIKSPDGNVTNKNEGD